MEKQMLVRIVLNPGKYNHFIGLPLAFDARAFATLPGLSADEINEREKEGIVR